MAESLSWRQSACNACNPDDVCVRACAWMCVCVHLCGRFNLCTPCNFHTLQWCIIFNFLMQLLKNDIPSINFLRHIYCDSSHLSILQMCSAGTLKGGGGDYIILAVPLPERHALKWAMLVRQIQWTKCRERLEIRGRHRSKAVAVSFIITWCDVDWGEHWQIQKDNPFVCSFPMVKPAWQTRHLTVQGLGACLYQDSTIKSSTCLGCKQSICSNVWKHGCISKLKGHSII